MSKAAVLWSPRWGRRVTGKVLRTYMSNRKRLTRLANEPSEGKLWCPCQRTLLKRVYPVSLPPSFLMHRHLTKGLTISSGMPIGTLHGEAGGEGGKLLRITALGSSAHSSSLLQIEDAGLCSRQPLRPGGQFSALCSLPLAAATPGEGEMPRRDGAALAVEAEGVTGVGGAGSCQREGVLLISRVSYSYESDRQPLATPVCMRAKQLAYDRQESTNPIRRQRPRWIDNVSHCIQGGRVGVMERRQGGVGGY